MPDDLLPRAAIEKWRKQTGKSLIYLAVESATSLPTIYAARDTNTWPKQARPRNGLRRVLGLDADPGHGGEATESNGKGSGR